MPQLRRDFELGANPVGAGDQHRPSGAAQLVQPGESPPAVQRFRPVGAGGQAPDALFQIIHPAQVNARLPVGVGRRIAVQFPIRRQFTAPFRQFCRPTRRFPPP